MSKTVEGIYAIRMSAEEGQGFGMFVFQDGLVTGIDPLGVRFDGTYAAAGDGDSFEASVEVTVPPNGAVIQGATAGPSGLKYDVLISLPADFLEKEFIRVETPLGPVNANFVRLRELGGNQGG